MRRILYPTPKKIQSIMDNNSCSMFIHYGCIKLTIKTGLCKGKIQCSLNNSCVLCQFHSKVEKQIANIKDDNKNNNQNRNKCDNVNKNEDKNNYKYENPQLRINNLNYNVSWYPKLLSQIRLINLDADWPCLCKQLPFKWLLKPSPTPTIKHRASQACLNFNNKNNNPKIMLVNLDHSNHCTYDFGATISHTNIDMCSPLFSLATPKSEVDHDDNHAGLMAGTCTPDLQKPINNIFLLNAMQICQK